MDLKNSVGNFESMHYSKTTNNSRWLWFLIVVHYIIFIPNWTTLADGLVNIPLRNNSENIGWISPDHDAFVCVGEPLEIFCTINSNCMKDLNFPALTFERSGGEQPNVTRINETTISLYLPNEKRSDSFYDCFFTLNTSILSKGSQDNGSEALADRYQLEPDYRQFRVLIGSVRVKVEAVPRTRWRNDSRDFRCTYSYSVDLFTCVWSKLKSERIVKTNHTIHFMPLNTTLPVSDYLYTYVECDAEECRWSLLENPPYFNDVEMWKITLKSHICGTNTIEDTFYFSHSIRPHLPDYVFVSQVTRTSCCLGWKQNQPSPYTWTYVISAYSYFPDYHTVDSPCKPKQIIEFADMVYCNVTELRPNTEYKFKVCMKLSQAPLDAGDDPFCIHPASAVTDSVSVPISPETDVSLFEIVDSNKSFRVVNIFWKPVADKYQYDPSMEYKIDLFNIDQAGNKGLVQTRAHFVKSKDFMDNYRIGYSGHQFAIMSKHFEGNATKASLINVPAKHDQVKPCTSFYVVARDYQDFRISFECIWQPPEKQPDIVSYTLFWWIDNFDYCQCCMNWTRLPADTTKHQILYTLDDFLGCGMLNNGLYERLQFYIGVNTKNSSSGLMRSMYKIHSVSHLWDSIWFRYEKYKLSEASPKKVDSERVPDKERVTYNGWKFSPNHFQKWMLKSNGQSP